MLKSDPMTISKILKKTKAKMFESLKVGDSIEFIVPLKPAGYHRGTYATYITIKNLKTGEETQSSFNQLPNVLKSFEFERERE